MIAIFAIMFSSCDDSDVAIRKVKFQTNSEQSVKDQAVEDGGFAIEPTIKLEKEGFSFMHWTLDNKEFKFKSTPVKSDITLVAKWSEIPSYTVKFTTGNDQEIESMKISQGEKLLAPPTVLKKDGFVFKYWTLNGEKYEFGKSIDKDIVLVAKWEVAVNKFNVTFTTGTSTSIDSQEVIEGESATKPTTALVKSAYVFKYWTLNDIEYNFDSAVTKDINLVAKWVKEFTVSFATGTSVAVSDLKIADGEKLTKPSTSLEKDGFKFKYWALNGSEYNFDSPVNSDITLTAVWEDLSLVTYQTISRADFEAWNRGDLKIVKAKIAGTMPFGMMGAWGMEIYLVDMAGNSSKDFRANDYGMFSFPIRDNSYVGKTYVFKLMKDIYMSSTQLGFGGTRADCYNGSKWTSQFAYGVDFFDEVIRGTVKEGVWKDGKAQLSLGNVIVEFPEIQTEADANAKLSKFVGKNVYANCIKKDGNWISKFDHEGNVQVSETLGGTGNPTSFK